MKDENPAAHKASYYKMLRRQEKVFHVFSALVNCGMIETRDHISALERRLVTDAKTRHAMAELGGTNPLSDDSIDLLRERLLQHALKMP